MAAYDHLGMQPSTTNSHVTGTRKAMTASATSAEYLGVLRTRKRKLEELQRLNWIRYESASGGPHQADGIIDQNTA